MFGRGLVRFRVVPNVDNRMPKKKAAITEIGLKIEDDDINMDWVDDYCSHGRLPYIYDGRNCVRNREQKVKDEHANIDDVTFFFSMCSSLLLVYFKSIVI
jgi:hypothetical protein